MDFLEKDLEEIIFNANLSELEERGLRMELQRKRQFRIGNYGIADIVGFERPYYHTHFKNHRKGSITVYELKKDTGIIFGGYSGGAMPTMKKNIMQIWLLDKTYSEFDLNMILNEDVNFSIKKWQRGIANFGLATILRSECFGGIFS
jgi:hypothetical protein